MDESTRNKILTLTSKIAIFIVLSALLLLNDFKWKKNDLNKKKNKEPEKNIKRHIRRLK